MEISLQVIGALGGATKQAVHKSGNPLRWLQRRIRCKVTPLGDDRAFYGDEIRRHAQASAKEFIRGARERLEDLPTPKSGPGKPGQRVRRNPEALARFLGVRWEEGDGLERVFARFIAESLQALIVTVLPLAGTGRVFGVDLDKILDVHWLPSQLGT